jgi:formamidopyrimidine-DNA glycosylase
VSIETELPEVETIRYALDREISGRKLKTVEAASMATLGRYRNRKQFTSRLEGRKLGPVRRRGLLLVSELDDGQLLVIKLGPGAQMRRNAARDAVEPGTEITGTFTVGGHVRLVDPEGGSQVCVIGGDELVAEFPEVAAGGMDPAGEMIPWTSFGSQVLARQMHLKDLLCDPSIVVGVGDVYSDEILFHAGLRHDRMSDSLSHQEVRRLHGALIQVVNDAIKYRGTDIEERPFRDVYGEPGVYGDHLAVYARAGALSDRNRTPIQRIKYKGGWTYYCETQV